MFVVGRDCEPIGAAVNGFYVGAVAACDDFFDSMSRFVSCAVYAGPVILGYGEERNDIRGGTIVYN